MIQGPRTVICEDKPECEAVRLFLENQKEIPKNMVPRAITSSSSYGHTRTRVTWAKLNELIWV